MIGASRWKPYPETKDSGIEWLGEIPEDWGVVPFKTVLARNDSGVWGDDPDGVSDRLVLRSTEQDVNGSWSIDDPAPRKLSERERTEALLIEGDLVVTKSSGSQLHIGKTSYVDEGVASLRACFSNFMQRLRLKSGNDPRLYWHLMNSPVCRQQFVFLSTTTTGLGNLNAGIIGAVWVPVASLGEQQAIADFLDRETAKVDALVEKKERLIELLQEKRTALITHAVTKGLPAAEAAQAGLDPNVPMKDSGTCLRAGTHRQVDWLGHLPARGAQAGIPAHWAETRLGWCVEVSGGHTPDTGELRFWAGEIPWVTPKDMKRRDITDSLDHVSEAALSEPGLRLLAPGSVLIVVRGMILVHTFPVAVLRVPATINQDMKGLFPRDGLGSDYLAYLLEGISGFMLSLVEESAHGTRRLQTELWKRVQLFLPPASEQAKIVVHLDRETAKIDSLIAKVSEAIERLKEYRTALISAAVTGKIDVREAA